MLSSFTFWLQLYGLPPSFAVFAWNASNEKRFLELFRKKVNPNYAVTHKERMELAESNPLAFLSSGMSYSLNTFRSIWKNYDDAELDQAAKQTRKGYIFTIIAMLTGWVLFSFIATLLDL